MLPLERKISDNFRPLLLTPNHPLPVIFSSLLPKVSPCYLPTFTRRTSGHFLETFRAVNFLTNLPILFKSRCLLLKLPHPIFLSLSLSVFDQRIRCKETIAVDYERFTDYISKLCKQMYEVLVSNLAVRTVTFLI